MICLLESVKWLGIFCVTNSEVGLYSTVLVSVEATWHVRPDVYQWRTTTPRAIRDRKITRTNGRYHHPPPQRDFDRPNRPQSSRIEILNDGGCRSDGLRQYELRDMTFDSTAQAGADGSARVAHGLTEGLVSVFGPREARVRAQTL